MAECQPTKHLDGEVDEVGDRIVGLGQRFDLGVEKLERTLREHVDQAVLRAEQAVDGAGGRPRLIGDGAHREGAGPGVGDDPLGRGAQGGAGVVVVFLRAAHA